MSEKNTKSHIVLTTADHSRSFVSEFYKSENALNSNYSLKIQEYGNPASVHIPCPIDCWWSPRSALITTYTVFEKNWKILYSMEGPQYYPILKQQLNSNVALATTSLRSDVPVPYIGNIFDMQRVAPSVFESGKNRASFIATNCNSKNNREEIVKELMKHYPVDSLASCLNNMATTIKKSRNWGLNKKTIMQKYKFHLAFENQCDIDYVTEKVWIALMSGTLPIYYGAPNIKELVPSHSMIHYTDFSSVVSLVAHLKHIEQNASAFAFYHQWRDKPLEDFVIEKYKHTNEHIQCRICKWVASRDLNLTWNQHLQDFAYTQTDVKKIPRILHQTSKYWGESNTYIFRKECEYMYRNDSWSYMYWSDADINEFVFSIYPQYYNRWKVMSPYIRKVDTVRYLWMHHFGGIYLDADAECIRTATSFVRGMPQQPTAWLGGYPEPFFLMSTPGNSFWTFVVDNILNVWSHIGTRQSSGPQGLNRWAEEWVRANGLHAVQLFSMQDPQELRAIDDRRGDPSWRWYIQASKFYNFTNRTAHKIGFLPNEVVDPTACFKHEQYHCTKYEHCVTIKDALFIHHCQGSHGI